MSIKFTQIISGGGGTIHPLIYGLDEDGRVWYISQLDKEVWRPLVDFDVEKLDWKERTGHKKL